MAYPGNPGGAHVVATAGFLGGVAEESNVNGSGTWQETTVCGGSPFSGTACEGGAPIVTMNGGLVNIAVIAANGDLAFWWQDSPGLDNAAPVQNVEVVIGEQAGPGGQGAGDGYPLAFAAGQGDGLAGGVSGGQAHRFEQRAGDGPGNVNPDFVDSYVLDL